MSDNAHPVITKNYPENLVGGIMVCGINFGYSNKDKRLESSEEKREAELLSFFSDTAVNNTRFRNRLLTWLSRWDMPLETKAGSEGAFERSFFQTNWLPTQTSSVTSDGAITINVLVSEADGLLTLLQERRPKTIIFVGATLIEALNDIRLRKSVESIMGARSGNAVIHRANSSNSPRKAFKLLTQSFGSTRVISLPHVQSRGLTDSYMVGFGPIVQSLLRS